MDEWNIEYRLGEWRTPKEGSADLLPERSIFGV
jgi:hypothetical protein